MTEPTKAMRAEAEKAGRAGELIDPAEASWDGYARGRARAAELIGAWIESGSGALADAIDEGLLDIRDAETRTVDAIRNGYWLTPATPTRIETKLPVGDRAIDFDVTMTELEIHHTAEEIKAAIMEALDGETKIPYTSDGIAILAEAIGNMPGVVPGSCKITPIEREPDHVHEWIQVTDQPDTHERCECGATR